MNKTRARSRTVRAALLTALVAAAFSLTGTATAGAATPAYTFTLRLTSAATGQCVDDSWGYNLRHFGCQDPYGQYADFQQFALAAY